MAAKTDSKWVREAMLKDQYMLWMHETRLKDTDCWGQTFACQPHFPDGKEQTVYVHVFRSEEKSHIETQAFYEEIEKFERDWIKRLQNVVLPKHSKLEGFFLWTAA